MKKIKSRLRSSACIMNSLPELPGYNGSVLTIDDVEASRITKDLYDDKDEPYTAKALKGVMDNIEKATKPD